MRSACTQPCQWHTSLCATCCVYRLARRFCGQTFCQSTAKTLISASVPVCTLCGMNLHKLACAINTQTLQHLNYLHLLVQHRPHLHLNTPWCWHSNYISPHCNRCDSSCLHDAALLQLSQAMHQLDSALLWSRLFGSIPIPGDGADYNLTHHHPRGTIYCSVWVGDGNLATIADACITIKILSRPTQAAASKAGTMLKMPSRRRKATWRQWLTCQDMHVEEPLLMMPDATFPLLQVDSCLLGACMSRPEQ